MRTVEEPLLDQRDESKYEAPDCAMFSAHRKRHEDGLVEIIILALLNANYADYCVRNFRLLGKMQKTVEAKNSVTSTIVIAASQKDIKSGRALSCGSRSVLLIYGTRRRQRPRERETERGRREKNFLRSLIYYPPRIRRPGEEQSPANSSVLITDVGTIRFSALLFQRRKNEGLSHGSAAALGAFAGKRAGAWMHSRELPWPLFRVARAKSQRPRLRARGMCVFTIARRAREGVGVLIEDVFSSSICVSSARRISHSSRRVPPPPPLYSKLPLVASAYAMQTRICILVANKQCSICRYVLFEDNVCIIRRKIKQENKT